MLADVIDREQGAIDDGHSVLLVDLARIVAGNTEQEVAATAAARQNWWAEAREGLLSVFISAHNSRQTRQGSWLFARSGSDGKAVAVGVDAADDPAPEEAHLPVAPPLLPLIRTRLDELLREEEARAAKAKGNILAAADDTVEAGRSGREEAGEQRGPLHLAVAIKQRLSDEAIARCLDAIEAARSDLFARGGKRGQRIKEAHPAAENGSTTSSSREGSSSGSGSCGGDERRPRGTHPVPEQEELGLFLSSLEASAVQLAAASFEPEVRLLAIGAATPPTAAAEVAALPQPPPEATIEEKALTLPLSQDDPPGDMTRSQLDLRRTARVQAFARALAEMLCRGREALQRKELQVPPPPLRVLPPSLDVLSGLTLGIEYKILSI